MGLDMKACCPNCGHGFDAQPPEINAEFVAEMIARFGDALGGEMAVKEQIEEALNHKASSKCKSQAVYVRGWLRRNAEEAQARNQRYGYSGRRTAVPEQFRNSESPATTSRPKRAIELDMEERRRRFAAMPQPSCGHWSGDECGDKGCPGPEQEPKQLALGD